MIVLHVDLLEEALRQPSPDSATAIALALTEIKRPSRAWTIWSRIILPRARLALQPAPMDARDAGDAVCPRNPPALAAHGITLRLDALDQLGYGGVHHHRFRRVFVNLVHDAINAMPQGGALEPSRGDVGPQRCPSPCGIPATTSPLERLPQIFEPLFIPHREPGGTGLRTLYGARGGRRASAARWPLQSTVGAGTTFTLTLPLVGAMRETRTDAEACWVHEASGCTPLTL